MAEMMGGTIQAIDEYKPTTKAGKQNSQKDVLSMRARLYGIAKKDSNFETTVDSLEGQLVCQLINGMNQVGANLTREPFKSGACSYED